ncbi:MAG: hypothetical protein HY332_12130 [Chloroflexi bacterium]|nr:hypothetical protein [Chloroflexota bacterium]
MENQPDRPDRHEEDAASTASRVEDWLRGLRAQRANTGETPTRTARSSSPAADDPAEAFLKAARRLAASPRAQEALARRLAGGNSGADDPSLRALVSVLDALGREISSALDRLGGTGGGSAGVLDRPAIRPDIVEERERRLSDDDGGGGDDIFDDDDDGGGDGGDDEEPWPSAFIGYRVGVVERIDVGNCRDGCCTAIFIDHPGLRAAVWFPTESAATLAASLGEWLTTIRGDTAELGVPPFGAGAAPARGQVQASIQFFTEDIHLDAVEDGTDRQQGGFARFIAYDEGLGHGGPPLVDALIDVAQARGLRRGLRRAARNASRERE